ncbi:DUF167 domain-containing protein [Candidatus Woesearchaeota archaeon]|nr:DUF167 domain-containing protein [Candidatus Woesearchaeota archaeon]
MYIQGKKFKILVKPNSRESKIEGFDKEKGAYKISIKAKPEGSKANIEIIKFLSRLLKKRVRIVSGFKSKEKIMEIIG